MAHSTGLSEITALLFISCPVVITSRVSLLSDFVEQFIGFMDCDALQVPYEMCLKKFFYIGDQPIDKRRWSRKRFAFLLLRF